MKSFQHLFFLFFFAGCGSIGKRGIAGQGSVSCLDDILKFSESVEFVKPAIPRNRWKEYRRYLDPIAYTKERTKLLQAIRHWAQAGERSLLLKDLRIRRVETILKRSLLLDNFGETRRLFEPLFSEVEGAYFRAKRLTLVLGQIKNLQETDDIFLKEEIYKYLMSDFSYELKRGGDLASIQEKIMAELNDEVYTIARKLHEYRSAHSGLIKALENSDTEVAEKAKKTLDRLESKYYLDDFFSFSKGVKREAVNSESLSSLIDRFPQAEIKSLKTELISEKWATLVTRILSDRVLELFDKVLKRVPWFNNSETRKLIKKIINTRDQLRHFPNIERILDDGSISAKYKNLRAFNAEYEGDELIVTFARRVDTREAWDELLDHAKKLAGESDLTNNSELQSDKDFYRRMNEALTKARAQGDLPEFTLPDRSYALKLILDATVVGIVGTGSWYGTKMGYKSIFGERPPPASDQALQDQVINAVGQILEEEEE